MGKDDPITPDEKLAIYKKVFPDQGHIFQTATDEIPDLTRVLSDLNRQGYTSATIVLGADQVKAFQYLKNYNGKADKAGNVPYTFDKLDVISRQETNDPSKDQEGPRATPMRAVLMDPTKSEQEQFQVWRDAMNPQVSDDEVRDLMMKAKERMQALVKPKKGLKEFAPGNGGGESGRWYTDDQMTDIVGDGWWNDLDVSGDIPKQEMIQQAQAWLDDQGYSVQVLNCRLNDNDMDWFIEGSFHNPGFAKKGVAEVTFKKSPYGRTAASQQRARELLNPPKPPEPKKDEKTDEEKQRLDPSCWKGYRKAGTKMKGDTRVNNCVKVSEGVENIMDALINKIIVNEAVQNNRK